MIDRGVLANGDEYSRADEVESSVSYELPDHVEILRLTGSAAIEGRGNTLDNVLDGTSNVAANRLTGGWGNDYYKVEPQDVVVEQPGEGIDTIEWNGTGVRTYTAADLPLDVEALAMGEDLGASGYQGDARSDRVTGNASDNLLLGDAGDDVLKGGAGNDTLDGGAGDDVLDGGAGYDLLRFARGFGRDIVASDTSYEVRFDASVGVADVAFDQGRLLVLGTEDSIAMSTGGAVRFADGTFWDANEVARRLDASHSHAASPRADSITGTAAADTIDALAGDDFVDGLGGNDVLLGGPGIDTMHGGADDDELQGGDDGDRLYGDAGNDVIAGGAGNDRAEGGDGADSLYGGAGDDALLGNAGNDILVGNTGDDQLLGGEGDDSLDVTAGSGYLAGEAGNDVLVGGVLSDVLVGGDGDDELRGGGGSDLLSGGAGVDTYQLAAGDGLDYVSDDDLPGELTVIALDASILPADVTVSRRVDEWGASTLVITANGGVDGLELAGAGRADRPVELRFSDGTIWSPEQVLDLAARIEGTAGDDALGGTTADDMLYGLEGNDTLDGFDGSDLLDGGAGVDLLRGGLGDDRYVVDSAGDTVVEAAYEGEDTVEAGVSFALPAEVEHLLLTGTAANGTGNALPTASPATRSPTCWTGRPAPTRWSAARATTPTSSTTPATW